MVIQSYAGRLLRTGIYPKGDLELSIDVIKDESKRLEKKIETYYI